MTDDDDNELQRERGTNEQYMRLLREGDDGARGAIRTSTSLPRNSQFLGTVAGGAGKGLPVEPLVGRVALKKRDPVLGTSFYIGSGYLNADDIIVIRWVTPMAKLFYKGSDADVDIADDLAARRTFSHRLDDLTSFEDAVEPHSPDSPFAQETRTLTAVDAPPAAPTRPTFAPSPARPTPPTPSPTTFSKAPTPATAPSTPEEQVRPMEPGEPAFTSAPASDPGVPPVETSESTNLDAVNQRLSLLRAPKTVLCALNAPRTGHLRALLRTLQPQQYDLVTWPEDEHLVVQGHPGTGKTVIGLHRAAFLTDPDRLPQGQRAPKGDVLVLGPTPAYVEHVRPVLNELAVDGWAVWSLPHLYSQIGNFADQDLPTHSDDISTSFEPLGRTITRVRETYRGPATPTDFTNYLFACGDDVQAAAEFDQDVIEFLRAGKNHQYAREHPRFHPTMALAGLVVTGVGLADRFRHIVVDEAQDLRPIDLQILRLLVGHGVTLTLLGDMNQRRSDVTHADWDQVSRDLNINRADGTPPLVPIAIGYRSTNQILRYAAGLLPRSERTAEALRDGPNPSQQRSSSRKTLLKDAQEQALRIQKSTGGLVAILTMRPRDMSDHLRTMKWTRGARRHAWRAPRTDSDILILHPDSARGLEFDGVVVVEPAEYPAFLGRHGLLYTSLTRANKELSVVYSKPLPRGLKSR